MMKRLIALLLAATMLVTLASGCGKKDESGKFTKGDLLTGHNKSRADCVSFLLLPFSNR